MKHLDVLPGCRKRHKVKRSLAGGGGELEREPWDAGMTPAWLLLRTQPGRKLVHPPPWDDAAPGRCAAPERASDEASAKTGMESEVTCGTQPMSDWRHE